MEETKETNFLLDFLSGLGRLAGPNLSYGLSSDDKKGQSDKPELSYAPEPPRREDADIEPPNPNDPSNYPDITAGGRFPIPAVETTGSTQAPGPSREASEAVLRGIPSDLLDILKQTTSEERRKFEADLNLQLYKEKLALSEAAALAKSREKSQRELELENIRSWKEIEKAQIMRDTLMATQLAQTAYIAGTPNANVLSAIGPSQRQVMAAFQPGKSVFPGGR